MSVETEPQTVRVGDFFRCSWGYDQTNVDFYEVLELTPSGRSAKVRRVRTECVDSDRNITHVVPIAGRVYEREPEILTKRLRWAMTRWAFKVTSYSTAYLWDGTPAYETASGWGH